MAIVTTRRNGETIAKPFTWSYSKLKNFEICELRHYEHDIAKSVPDEDSEHLIWGNRLHDTAAKRLADHVALPDDVKTILTPWIDRIEATPGTILTERKYAFTRDLTATTYFAKDVWFRGVADVVKLGPRAALAVDWKSGKIIEDSVQLALMAQCVFIHHPQVEAVRTEFIWLKEDASSQEVFYRMDMPLLWQRLLPRVRAMEEAHNSGIYRPQLNGYCARFCRITKCVNHGKRA